MLYVITGVPGIGKSTLVGAFQKLTGYKWVNYGDLMFNLAKKKKLAKAQDEVRHLTEKAQAELQREAAKQIAKMKGHVILTTHITIKTKKDYLPGFTPETLKILKPKAFVLLESDPRMILKFRNKDKTRSRKDQGGINEIARHQNVNRLFAYAYSSICGADVLLFHHSYSNPKKEAERLRLMLT